MKYTLIYHCSRMKHMLVYHCSGIKYKCTRWYIITVGWNMCWCHWSGMKYILIYHCNRMKYTLIYLSNGMRYTLIYHCSGVKAMYAMRIYVYTSMHRCKGQLISSLARDITAVVKFDSLLVARQLRPYQIYIFFKLRPELLVAVVLLGENIICTHTSLRRDEI